MAVPYDLPDLAGVSPETLPPVPPWATQDYRNPALQENVLEAASAQSVGHQQGLDLLRRNL